MTSSFRNRRVYHPLVSSNDRRDQSASPIMSWQPSSSSTVSCLSMQTKSAMNCGIGCRFGNLTSRGRRLRRKLQSSDSAFVLRARRSQAFLVNGDEQSPSSALSGTFSRGRREITAVARAGPTVQPADVAVDDLGRLEANMLHNGLTDKKWSEATGKPVASDVHHSGLPDCLISQHPGMESPARRVLH